MNQHEMATKKLPDTTMTLQDTSCNTKGSFLISSALPAACLKFSILATQQNVFQQFSRRHQMDQQSMAHMPQKKETKENKNASIWQTLTRYDVLKYKAINTAM
jgi:hypothetical protein